MKRQVSGGSPLSALFRAFFRRGITRSYACVRGDMSCQVNSITRTNCKKCRFERCLQVGMRPELVDASLRRKQEEKRRAELIGIQQDMGIPTLESENQAGMNILP